MRRILSIILPSGRISWTGFLSHLFGILSWYDLPSFLSCLFPPLSVPHPISVTFQLHPTLSACLLLPPLQLRGVLVQLCYFHAWTSLGLTLDLLGPDPHTNGSNLHPSHNSPHPSSIFN